MQQSGTPELLALQAALRGRYVLECELGRGGMGIVFLGRDLALERPVAIKLLPPHFAGIPEIRARFLQEARTAARLAHPHIVPIHAVEADGDLACFVMSYVPGRTLAEVVREDGPLSPAATGRMVQEVAWALAYAHQQGVVHRDVKPENILIERGTGRALVMDFGIAQVARATPITPPEQRLGTPRYASPELAAGEPVDGRSDLYSLGVTAFFALTGRTPFEGDHGSALLVQHLTAMPPPVASLRPGTPASLARAIDRCLAKNPADRYPDGESLAAALDLSETVRRTPPLLARLAGELSSFSADLSGYGTLAAIVLLAQTLTIDFLGFGQIYALGIALVMLSLTTLKGIGLARTLRETARQGWSVGDIRAALVANAGEDARDSEMPLWRSGAMYLAGIAALLAFWVGPRESVLSTLTVGPLVLVTELFSLLMPVALGRWFGARLDAPRAGQPGPLSRLMTTKAGWLLRLLRPRRAPALPLPDNRPTVLLLGDQAEALFRALPAADRTRLDGVEKALARLRERAAQLHRQDERYSTALAEIGGTGNARREGVRRELEDEQRSNRAALGEAVATLDTLRLDLLRLRAGTLTTEGMTEALETVRRVGAEVDARLAAVQELRQP
ncbi:MAG: serine/threonine protein kinase [Gemmatimonadota bacterium]|nr:serine/threonine protein kinase [Gemmatimonadota bacterium]